MPFEIRPRGSKLVVVTKGGPNAGHVHGTFPKTPAGRARAKRQLRALYANVPEARS